MSHPVSSPPHFPRTVPLWLPVTEVGAHACGVGTEDDTEDLTVAEGAEDSWMEEPNSQGRAGMGAARGGGGGCHGCHLAGTGGSSGEG